MIKLGKHERCNHKPCVCEGLGGYMRITDIERRQVGQKLVDTEVVSLYQDVFSYSWLRAVKM